MRNLFIDIETFSSVSLKDCGVDKYAQSPDFEILLLGYAFDNDPVQVVELARDGYAPCMPKEVFDAILFDKNVTKIAHNARFERTCLTEYFRRHGPLLPYEWLDPSQWLDTMLLASACGLPLSLADVGIALELPKDSAKMLEGRMLIKQFCVPCKPTKKDPGRIRHTVKEDPEKWAKFVEYNRRDVEVERTIYNRLIKWRPDYSEHKLFVVDQTINDRGVRVDLQLAENAMRIGNDYKAELMDRATEISGLANPNSADQVKAWLKETEGFTVDSLNKKVIADVKEKLSTEQTKEFMALRDEFSKSSVKKFETIIRCATYDDHVHGCMLMNGAGRTGRWAGRLLQVQNLPHDTIEDIDIARQFVRDGDEESFRLFYPDVQKTLSMLIRTAIIPEEGHKFLVADFSAIEARVTAFLAGEQWRMEAFASGRDIYCESASRAFKIPVEKHGINSEYRKYGKVIELACGYGGSIGAMKAFNAQALGMTEEDMANAVAAWRNASPHIVALWSSLEKAAMKAIIRKTSAISAVGNIRFDFEDGVLWMNLPSGRRIAYWGAQIGENKFGDKSITYMGTDQKAKKWARLETFGGKLTENLVQATSRDCLKETLIRLYDAGFDVRMHVHDEVIVDEPIGGRSADDVCKIMGTPIDWAPGLVLTAEGAEVSSYRKV